MLDALWGIARKEFVQIRRASFLVRRIVLIQSVNFIMLAWLELTVRGMPTVVVDQDRSAESRLLVERVVATGTFAVKYETSSVNQARDHIRAGRASAAVVIPPEYAAKRAAGTTARILTLVDGSDPVSSSQAITAMNGVASRLNLEAQQDLVDVAPTVTPHDILMFNPQGRASSFTIPALLAILVATIYSMNGMRRLVQERAGGHLDRLLMTPVGYPTLVAGKLFPWLVIGLVNSAVYLLIARFGLGVPIRGSLAALFFALALYLATVLSLGSFIAAGARTQEEATTKWNIINFPAIFLSGYIFPLSSLPTWLLPISYAMPQTHFIEVMRGICLRGAGLHELLPQMVYLVVAPIVFLVWGQILFARSLRQ